MPSAPALKLRCAVLVTTTVRGLPHPTRNGGKVILMTIRFERSPEPRGELGILVCVDHLNENLELVSFVLRFQKQLRLQEARRLLVADDYDAASAAYRVGYDDPSHFSREASSGRPRICSKFACTTSLTVETGPTGHCAMQVRPPRAAS